MTINDETILKFPNPYKLFESTKEGMNDIKTVSDTIKQTDDSKTQTPKKLSLSGMLIAVFFILLFIISVLYYVYANFFLIDKLFQTPYYNITNFWRYYRAPILSGKLTIFLFLWMIVFSINILIFDFVFNNKDILNIFYYTTIYYIGIVGSTFLIIGNIPSLVEIFENTIGYNVLCIPFLYNMKKIMSIFKNKHFKSREFEIPYDFLITTFDLPSFNDLFNKLLEEGKKVKSGTDELLSTDGIETDFYFDFPENISERTARYNLLKMVLAKNGIGHMMWAFLGSYVTIMLTINTIIPKT